jgi:hypothetical protein
MRDSATEAAIYVVIEGKTDIPFCTAYVRFDPKRTSQRRLICRNQGLPTRCPAFAFDCEHRQENLNVNKSEPRIFHVCERVKRDRQRRGKNEHVNPAARFGSGHTKSSK